MADSSACIAKIRSLQISKMAVKPEGDHYYTDTGLYLFNCLNTAINQAITLMDCRFMGLRPMEDYYLLVALVPFPNLLTKGYFVLSEISGNEIYDKIPQKSEDLTITASLMPHYFAKNQTEPKLVSGSFGELYLPLLCKDYFQ